MTADKAKDILSKISPEDLKKIAEWYRQVAKCNENSPVNTPSLRAELIEKILNLGN